MLIAVTEMVLVAMFVLALLTSDRRARRPRRGPVGTAVWGAADSGSPGGDHHHGPGHSGCGSGASGCGGSGSGSDAGGGSSGRGGRLQRQRRELTRPWSNR